VPPAFTTLAVSIPVHPLPNHPGTPVEPAPEPYIPWEPRQQQAYEPEEVLYVVYEPDLSHVSPIHHAKRRIVYRHTFGRTFYFNPNQAANRAEFAVMVVNYLGLGHVNNVSNHAFTDISGHWAAFRKQRTTYYRV